MTGGKSNPTPPEACHHPGCGVPLRVNNLSRLCRQHRNKVTSRQRINLVPKLARVAGSAGNALRTPPAKAAKMAAAAESEQSLGTDYRQLPGQSLAHKYGLHRLGDLELDTLGRLVEAEEKRRALALPVEGRAPDASHEKKLGKKEAE